VDTTPTRGIIEPPVSPDLVPEDFRPQSSGAPFLHRRYSPISKARRMTGVTL
jgi:hypothetical protein